METFVAGPLDGGFNFSQKSEFKSQPTCIFFHVFTSDSAPLVYSFNLHYLDFA